MKTRTDLLNHLVEKYNLKKYVEIGVNDPTQNFDKINCEYKIGVDPSPEAKKNFYSDPKREAFSAFFNVTSDSFFDSWSRRPGEFICTMEENKRDLIFIDGLHTAEQVKKDFENALKILSPNGFIVLHDCNPEKEEHTIVPRPSTRGHWNGDVYKFAIGMHNSSRYTVDIDNGCAVYSNRSGINSVVHKPFVCSWAEFDQHRKQLLNLITWDEFISIDSHV